MKLTLTQLNDELKRLTEHWYICNHPKVKAAITEVKAENAPRVVELKQQIEALRGKRKVTPRWPENTPPDVLKSCEAYWGGTEEKLTFRIHIWSDKGIWTSYPSGGYTSNSGWNPTPAAYYLIPRNTTSRYGPLNAGVELKELCFERNSGKRVTPKMMQEELDKL